MKKNLLTVCLSLISFLVMAQNSDKGLITSKIQEFKKHLYLSTSQDPLAPIKAKSMKAKELEAHELITRSVHSSKLKSGEVEGAYIDTTHTYPWNPETQDWDTVPTMQIIQEYDDNHNLAHYIDYNWNYDTKSWLENVQFFYKYNEKNQKIDVIQQALQFDGYESYNWYNIDYGTYEYNELGQQSRYTYRYWNFETNDWEVNWKQEFSYDERGNNIETIESYWDAGSYEWMLGMNVVNKFDSNNNIVENPVQYWDYSKKNWINTYRNIYGYDSNSLNISLLIQSWNPDFATWENSAIQELFYNELNNVDNYVVKEWDSFLSEWVYSQRATYKYDSQGNNVCILGETYDSNSNSWTTSWANYYEYNEKNKLVSDETLYWDSGVGLWSFGSRTKNGKTNLHSIPENRPSHISNLTIYPNPAKDVIYIQNSNYITCIEIINTAGNLTSIKNNTDVDYTQVDVSSLKPGLYFLRIKDSKGEVNTKRLIKQ